MTNDVLPLHNFCELGFTDKFWTIEALLPVINRRRRVSTPGQIWFTSGCFDLFHVGHLQFLKTIGLAAMSEGSFLIVAVNSDESVQVLKNKKPVMSTLDRKILVANIPEVRYVLQFDEKHPTNLVNLIQPEVIVHGHSEERPAFTHKENELQNYHGRVVRFSCGQLSTSKLIERVLNDYR